MKGARCVLPQNALANKVKWLVGDLSMERFVSGTYHRDACAPLSVALELSHTAQLHLSYITSPTPHHLHHFLRLPTAALPPTTTPQ
jgi:hypothetical protein